MMKGEGQEQLVYQFPLASTLNQQSHRALSINNTGQATPWLLTHTCIQQSISTVHGDLSIASIAFHRPFLTFSTACRIIVGFFSRMQEGDKPHWCGLSYY